MKNKINIKSLVFGALLGALVVFSMGAATDRSDESSQAKACEYKVITGNYAIADLTLQSQIQKASAEGWRVVSSGGGDDRPFVILCRPK